MPVPSAEGGLMPPISSVNGMMPHTSMLFAEVGLMPRHYFYCKWSDTSYLLSAEDAWLDAPPLYLL